MNTGLGSFQKWRIGSIVREILLGNADLYALVGEDIFPIVAPEGTLGNFIVYRRDKYSKEYTKLGVVDDVCHLAVSAIADNYDTALDIAVLLDNTLTGKHTTSNGENFIMKLIDSTEDFGDNKYVETLLFEIK